MGAGSCGADVIRNPPVLATAGGLLDPVESQVAGSNPSRDGLHQRRPASDGKSERSIDMEEVARHNSAGDAWIVIKNKVYDVSNFVDVHPGGKVILTYAGKDATDVFSAFHDTKTWTMLPKLCIGELTDKVTPALLADFRDLRSQMLRERVFESSTGFYIYKFLSTMSLLAVSVAAISVSSNLLVVVLSGILLGLFWQQCGWLSHDFAHHQVFKQREINNFFAMFLGNFCQGYSLAWWKAKHNTHHAAPNALDEKYQIIDPDIDTLPLLAWSKEILGTVQSKSLRALLRWQAHLFLPMLLFARFAWLHSSWTFAFSETSGMSQRDKILERSALVLHYICTLLVSFSILPIPLALVWLLAGEVTCGIFLGLVFVQSHNGMEIYSDEKDFYSAQIVSTRNVQQSLFNDWFTGGLNRQIEHHLFPTVPRHNLEKICPRVKALCEKHGLVYEDVDMVTGTSLVLERLAQVAALA